MNADIKGCLKAINQSYRIFTYKGMPMKRNDVEALLLYGLGKGYTSTAQITGQDIELILKQGKEVVLLKNLEIGDRFYNLKDKKKTPYRVASKVEFNIQTGSPTRNCVNELTGVVEKKLVRKNVVKL